MAFSLIGLVAAAFVIGAVLIFLFSLLPRFRNSATEIWPLYRSEFLIVGAMLLAIGGGKWVLFGAAIVIAARGQFEIAELLGRGNARMSQALGVVMDGAVLLTALFVPAASAAMAALLAIGLGFGAIFAGRQARSRILSLLVGLFFPTLLLAMALGVRARPDGFAWMFVALATVEAHDSFALLTGKLMGRHLLWPALSPKKTWEGLAGGVALGGAVGFLAARLLLGLAAGPALAMIVALLAAGLAGDFAVSGLKRWRGRKDFAPIAAAHGGLLDICDSMLFAVPVLLLFQPA